MENKIISSLLIVALISNNLTTNSMYKGTNKDLRIVIPDKDNTDLTGSDSEVESFTTKISTGPYSIQTPTKPKPKRTPRTSPVEAFLKKCRTSREPYWHDTTTPLSKLIAHSFKGPLNPVLVDTVKPLQQTYGKVSSQEYKTWQPTHKNRMLHEFREVAQQLIQYLYQCNSDFVDEKEIERRFPSPLMDRTTGIEEKFSYLTQQLKSVCELYKQITENCLEIKNVYFRPAL